VPWERKGGMLRFCGYRSAFIQGVELGLSLLLLSNVEVKKCFIQIWLVRWLEMRCLAVSITNNNWHFAWHH